MALELAIENIKSGNITINKASQAYHVPKTTIIDRLKGRSSGTKKKTGPSPLLGEDVENKIKNWVLNIAKCGFPIHKEDLFDTVEKLAKDLKKKELFNNGRPGQKWYTNFMKRHPEIAVREAEGVTKGRAIVTEEYIRGWFKELDQYLVENNLLDVVSDPTRVFNGDEVGFSLCPKKGKVLAPKGTRNVLNISLGNDKLTITVLMIITADGQIAPPLVVFPYVRPPRIIVDAMPENWVLGRSETGWMRGDVFYEYIANDFAKWLENNQIKKPIILFIDGHKSHLTLAVSEVCEKLGIILYALPPNTTHLLQPADVSVFHPMKVNWKNTLRQWHNIPGNENKVVTRELFCPLFQSSLQNNNMTQSIINGFRKCGLFPVNPEAVDYTKCIKNSLEKLHDEKEGKSIANAISKADLITAEKVILRIRDRLILHGIDVDLIVNEINSLQNENDINKNKQSNETTIEVGEIISLQDAQIVPCEIVVQEEPLNNTNNNLDGVMEINGEDCLNLSADINIRKPDAMEWNNDEMYVEAINKQIIADHIDSIQPDKEDFNKDEDTINNCNVETESGPNNNVIYSDMEIGVIPELETNSDMEICDNNVTKNDLNKVLTLEPKKTVPDISNFKTNICNIDTDDQKISITGDVETLEKKTLFNSDHVKPNQEDRDFTKDKPDFQTNEINIHLPDGKTNASVIANEEDAGMKTSYYTNDTNIVIENVDGNETLDKTANRNNKQRKDNKEENDKFINVEPNLGGKVGEKVNIQEEIVENIQEDPGTNREEPKSDSDTLTPKVRVLSNLVIRKATEDEVTSPTKIFEKHLGYPETIEKSTNRKSRRMPSAISSAKWREYYNKSDEIKQRKAEDIQKRKEMRAKAKEGKEKQKTVKMQRKTKTKAKPQKENISESQSVINKEPINCATCLDPLISDAEDEDDMNIGCDKCPLWFHMKCTEFYGISYEEASLKDYICFKCS